LKETGKQLLGEVFDIIFKHHKEFLRVEVVGHTDNVPLKSTAQDNWSLSANRAVAVVRFAISRGFTTSIISATGYGEYRPIASNETAEGKQLNRRIEILLVYSRSDKFILSLFKKKVKDQIIVPSETKPVVPTPDGKIHTK
jgi:chemotaxis protein MotB